MDTIMPIIVDIVKSPFFVFYFGTFLFCLGLLVAWAMLLYGIWQWRQGHKQIQTLVERIRAIHAQAGTRPRHLPSLAFNYRFFPESINWIFRLDRELNALERQCGMRVPYSQRRLFLASSEEVLDRFSQRVEALEGSQRSSPSPS